jgi:hypothetical protein
MSADSMSLHASLSPYQSEPGVQVPVQFAARDRFENYPPLSALVRPSRWGKC